MSAGQGKPGYCSLCAHASAPKVNKMINQGANAKQIATFLSDNFDFPVDRRTIYAHKPHALTPENRVIQAAAAGQKKLAIRKSSNTGFLEAVRDIGFTRAMEDPDAISIEHALKAVQILEGRKDKAGDQLNILIQITTGQRPPIVIEDEVIEGTAVEVLTE